MDRPTATCGDGGATVSWTAPAGASAVTAYQVIPFIGYCAQPSTTFNSTATTQTLTVLTNGTQYRFKVAALKRGRCGPDLEGEQPRDTRSGAQRAGPADAAKVDVPATARRPCRGPRRRMGAY